MFALIEMQIMLMTQGFIPKSTSSVMELNMFILTIKQRLEIIH